MLRMIIQSLFLFMMLTSGVTAEEQLSDTTAKNDRVHYQLLPNKKMSDEKYYGYDDFYYIPSYSDEKKAPSLVTSFMVEGKEIATNQLVIDDYEGIFSVEKYISSKDELILVRAINFEGLEFIREFFDVYQRKDDSFIYLGGGTYNSGNELEYNMMMADKTLIPKDDKDYFSKVTLTSDDDFINLTVTNFLQTNTQHFKLPKQYK